MATVRFSWMQKINTESRVLFFSDAEMPCEAPDVIQNDTWGAGGDNPVHNLGYKELRLWEHVIDNDTLMSEFDWFYKVDDDSYVFPGNVARLVSRYDKRSIHYLGRVFRIGKTDIMFTPGGPGYILSWATLMRLKNNPFPTGRADTKWTHRCDKYKNMASDTFIGYCLRDFGILPQQAWSVDDGEGELFTPFHEQAAFTLNGTGWWYADYAWYGHNTARNCCSTNMVAFHYMDATHALSLEFVLYGMRPHIRRNETAAALLSADFPARFEVFCSAFRAAVADLNWTLALDSPPLDDAYCNQWAHNQSIFLRFEPLALPTKWCPRDFDRNATEPFPFGSWCGALTEPSQRIEAWRCVPFSPNYQRHVRNLFFADSPINSVAQSPMAHFFINELNL